MYEVNGQNEWTGEQVNTLSIERNGIDEIELAKMEDFLANELEVIIGLIISEN